MSEVVFFRSDFGPESKGKDTKKPQNRLIFCGLSLFDRFWSVLVAERQGFEPWVPKGYNGFRDRPDRPLRHLSLVVFDSGAKLQLFFHTKDIFANIFIVVK